MTRERMEETNRIRIKWKYSRGFKIVHKYLSEDAYILCAAIERKTAFRVLPKKGRRRHKFSFGVMSIKNYLGFL